MKPMLAILITLTILVCCEYHVRIVVLGDASSTCELTMETVAVRTPFAVYEELEVILASADVVYGERSIGLVI